MVAWLLCGPFFMGESHQEKPQSSLPNIDYSAFMCLNSVYYGFHCSWKM